MAKSFRVLNESMHAGIGQILRQCYTMRQFLLQLAMPLGGSFRFDYEYDYIRVRDSSSETHAVCLRHPVLTIEIINNTRGGIVILIH